MSSKANRAYYLSRGLCPRCGGKNRVQEGRCLCIECQKKHDEDQTERRKLWRETGLCTRCGGERDGWQKMCADCREYMSDIKRENAKKAKARRDALKMKGLCVKCGKTWEELGRTMCKSCLEKHRITCAKESYREKVRQRRKERVEAGLCIDCGKPTEDGKQRCARCIEMRRDSGRKYTIKRRMEREAQEARKRSRA